MVKRKHGSGKNKKSDTRSVSTRSQNQNKRSRPDLELDAQNVVVESDSPERFQDAVVDTTHNKRRFILKNVSESKSDNNNAIPQRNEHLVLPGPSGISGSEAVKSRKSITQSVFADVEGDVDELLDYEDDVVVTVQDREDEAFPIPSDGKVDEFDPLGNEEDFEENESNVVTFKSPAKSDKASNANFDSLRADPAFNEYIKKMVAAELGVRVQDQGAIGTNSGPDKQMRSPLVDPLSKRQASGDVQTPKRRPGIPLKGRGGNGVGCLIDSHPKIKSPSDTTLYAPALQLVAPAQQVFNQTGVTVPVNAVVRGGKDAELVNNDIANFIQGIRLQSAVTVAPPREDVQQQQQEAVGEASRQPSHFDQQVNQGKEKAAELILEAEQFKAAVNTPGMFQLGLETDQVNLVQNDANLSVLQNNGTNAGPRLCEDDEFFHVSCHVDSGIKLKIQRGDFVELERLLPKPKNFRQDNTGRMDLVFRNGRSYFVPAVSDNRIMGVRRWEQAFRVYAAIYSEANLSRAAEIWQYVHIINVAAGAYAWDNVASYDYTFRQLMAANPHRSWAKIYNQMWNLSMRDPFPKQSHFGQNNSGGGTPKQGQKGDGKNNQNKPKYCWAFNRGKCQDGTKCKFVHRCSVCDVGNHGKNACPKRGGSSA